MVQTGRLIAHPPWQIEKSLRFYEDNAGAHPKRTIMGRETMIAITNGELDFGTWEQVFYFEFDGKRDKRVLIKIIGE